MNNRKQITILYEFYKTKANEMGLNYLDRIKLINVFILEFIKFEEYESAAYFKYKKIDMYKKFRKSRRLLSIRLFYRVWRLRINKIMKMITKLFT